eukprot:scpid12586/ scgid29613/ 
MFRTAPPSVTSLYAGAHGRDLCNCFVASGHILADALAALVASTSNKPSSAQKTSARHLPCVPLVPSQLVAMYSTPTDCSAAVSSLHLALNWIASGIPAAACS